MAVRLTPSAASDAIDGLVEDAAGIVRLKARVRAVPEKSKVNRALEVLIAKRLRLPKSTIRVISGETSRNKIVRIGGDPKDLAAAAAALVEIP